MSTEYRIGNGSIRRSRSGKGAPYWGRLRINPHQLAALVAWTEQNTPQSWNDEVYWELEIACWLKDGQEGEKWFSFAAEQPYKSQKVEVGSVAPLAPGRGPGQSPSPAPAPAPAPAQPAPAQPAPAQPAPVAAAAAPASNVIPLDLDKTPF